jgi:predicted ABC-type transport system involved in lysophospholipase L1 biosynthesis ATPase subunit
MFSFAYIRAEISVTLITHDPALAGAAPRVVRLRDGRVVEPAHAAAS